MAPARRSNPVLAPEERFLRPFLVSPKMIILIQRRGKSKKQKLLEMGQVTVLFHTDEFILVWSLKNGNGCRNWVTSTGGCQNLLPRSHSQLGVVCNMFPEAGNLDSDFI